MRIRTIKPEFFRHAELYDCELTSGLPMRVAFAGLWCVADREGRFKWEARSLKVQILPYDNCDFSAVLQGLESGGFIKRYVVDDKEYGFIPTFAEHQHINQREAVSILPEPTEEACARTCTHVQEYACTEINMHARGEGKGREKEGKGKEKEGEAQSPTAPRRVRESFDVNSIVIPPELQGAQFLQFWPQWVAIRLKKPKPPDGWQKYFQEQVDWLKGYGASVAGATVEESYRGRWQGLFPDKHAGRAISGAANGIPAKPKKTDGGGHEVIMGKYL